MRLHHSSVLGMLPVILALSLFIGVLGQAPNSKEAMLAEINKFRSKFGKKAVCMSPYNPSNDGLLVTFLFTLVMLQSWPMPMHRK